MSRGSIPSMSVDVGRGGVGRGRGEGIIIPVNSLKLYIEY